MMKLVDLFDDKSFNYWRELLCQQWKWKDLSESHKLVEENVFDDILDIRPWWSKSLHTVNTEHHAQCGNCVDVYSVYSMYVHMYRVYSSLIVCPCILYSVYNVYMCTVCWVCTYICTGCTAYMCVQFIANVSVPPPVYTVYMYTVYS